VTITVPLEIRLRLGEPVGGVQVTAAPAAATGVAGEPEAIVIDPDFAARKGFDTGFLGPGHDVALPQLSPAQEALASIDSTATAAPRNLLRYHHYSAVVNAERRLAYWVGVNIDGAQHTWRTQLARTKDKWFFDPRIPRDEQVGEEIYTKNALDRGHLVRRLDPAWGPDLETAKKGNDDTFHFTNCTPQHEDFNQNKTTWAGLEDYILDNAGNRHFKANVFTGPVFADDDDLYRGVKLPRQFWKVVTMVKEDGTLSATGYLLSQARLIDGLESDEPFSYGAYKTFQVKVAEVARLTGLSFGALPDADPLEGLESTGGPIEITSADSLVL
jgi:endonuclease G